MPEASDSLDLELELWAAWHGKKARFLRKSICTQMSCQTPFPHFEVEGNNVYQRDFLGFEVKHVNLWEGLTSRRNINAHFPFPTLAS